MELVGDHPGRVAHRLPDVLLLELGVGREHVGYGSPPREHLEDDADCDTHAPNRRLAETHAGLRGDPVELFHDLWVSGEFTRYDPRRAARRPPPTGRTPDRGPPACPTSGDRPARDAP